MISVESAAIVPSVARVGNHATAAPQRPATCRQ
jgi:hypothetical protein